MSPTKRYERIAQIMDEAYRDYENGLVALRRRVVDQMRSKLREAGVLDHQRQGWTPRPSPPRKRT